MLNIDIAIMADGSEKIGMGHIMRTSVIAHVLKNRYNVFYICSELPEYESGRNLIRDMGFKVFDLKEEKKADIIIIDKYDINENYFSYLNKIYKKVIYIDDLNNLNYYDVDIIINRNIGAEKLFYNTNSNCKKMLGTNYNILRKEFRKAEPIEIKDRIENILITMGGSDPTYATLKLLDFLKDSNYNILVTVGNGFSQNNINKLKEIERNYSNIKLFFSPNMTQLFSLCDVAFSACGGTIYELAVLGVPIIGVIVAENQKMTALNAKEAGILNLLGNTDTLKKEDIEKSLNSLKKKEVRIIQSNKEKEIVKRNGVELILKEIYKLI